MCRTHLISSFFGFIIPQALYVTAAYALGAPVMEGVLAAIPEFVQHGLTVAAGILPALGFVILLRTIMDRKLLPYLILDSFSVRIWACQFWVFRSSPPELCC